MKKQISINPLIQTELNLPELIGVQGETVRECLADLARQYPRLKSLLTETNEFMQVLVAINNKMVDPASPDANLDTRLTASDKISLIGIISGG